MSRAWTKLTLFSRIVMKRWNAVEKSKNWEGDGREKDSKGCGLMKSLLTTGRNTRWQYFKLHLVDLNWFSDRSRFKALDHSVAFDMKGNEDSEDRRSLVLVS